MFRLHNVPMLVSLRRDFVGRPMLTIIFDSQIKRRHPTQSVYRPNFIAVPQSPSQRRRQCAVWGAVKQGDRQGD
jgi:hypothetical protein